MSRLEISKIEASGEHCWGVSLIDGDNNLILQNTTPLAKGVALSVAKTLKHKGGDAPLIWEPRKDSDAAAWVVEKTSDGWQIKFTPVDETLFIFQLKPEDKAGDEKAFENAFETVKSNLAKAEVAWNPPEVDPAHKEKISDSTQTKGYPGSCP